MRIGPRVSLEVILVGRIATSRASGQITIAPDAVVIAFKWPQRRPPSFLARLRVVEGLIRPRHVVAALRRRPLRPTLQVGPGPSRPAYPISDTA